MSGLYESAAAVMRVSQQRIDVASHNVANASTPGYKRRVGFADLVASSELLPSLEPSLSVRHVLSQGRLISTGNPLDLAVSGGGLFQLRKGDSVLYTRQGQFHLAEDGRVVSPQGYALQQAGGGDLVLEHAAVQIQDDGAVLDQGRPVARIALFAPQSEEALERVGEAHFAAPESAIREAEDGALRQGMLESSNVQMGDEMVAMMAALREAESGAKLMQAWDELIGQAINTLGRGGK